MSSIRLLKGQNTMMMAHTLVSSSQVWQLEKLVLISFIFDDGENRDLSDRLTMKRTDGRTPP